LSFCPTFGASSFVPRVSAQDQEIAHIRKANNASGDGYHRIDRVLPWKPWASDSPHDRAKKLAISWYSNGDKACIDHLHAS
jgi:hypothetical protein